MRLPFKTHKEFLWIFSNSIFFSNNFSKTVRLSCVTLQLQSENRNIKSVTLRSVNNYLLRQMPKLFLTFILLSINKKKKKRQRQ